MASGDNSMSVNDRQDRFHMLNNLGKSTDKLIPATDSQIDYGYGSNGKETCNHPLAANLDSCPYRNQRHVMRNRRPSSCRVDTSSRSKLLADAHHYGVEVAPNSRKSSMADERRLSDLSQATEVSSIGPTTSKLNADVRCRGVELATGSRKSSMTEDRRPSDLSQTMGFSSTTTTSKLNIDVRYQISASRKSSSGSLKSSMVEERHSSNSSQVRREVNEQNYLEIVAGGPPTLETPSGREAEYLQVIDGDGEDVSDEFVFKYTNHTPDFEALENCTSSTATLRNAAGLPKAEENLYADIPTREDPTSPEMPANESRVSLCRQPKCVYVVVPCFILVNLMIAASLFYSGISQTDNNFAEGSKTASQTTTALFGKVQSTLVNVSKVTGIPSSSAVTSITSIIVAIYVDYEGIAYVDGQESSRLSSVRVQRFRITPASSCVAVLVVDKNRDMGLIMNTNTGIVSDVTWKCTSQPQSTNLAWTTADFNDTLWPNAVVKSSSHIKATAVVGRLEFPRGHQWIGVADNNVDMMYCRRRLR